MEVVCGCLVWLQVRGRWSRMGILCKGILSPGGGLWGRVSGFRPLGVWEGNRADPNGVAGPEMEAAGWPKFKSSPPLLLCRGSQNSPGSSWRTPVGL